MRKKLVIISLFMIILTGCENKGTAIEIAQKSKNSVICTTIKELDYRDIEALRKQKEGTYKEGLEDANIDNYDEIRKKAENKTGTYTQEYIYEFNDKGTEVKKIYLIINNTFTHEDVTDDLLEANKKYLENYYKNSDDYIEYNLKIEGKSVIRELTINMDKVPSKDFLKITKKELIERSSYSSDDRSVVTTCKEN